MRATPWNAAFVIVLLLAVFANDVAATAAAAAARSTDTSYFSSSSSVSSIQESNDVHVSNSHVRLHPRPNRPQPAFQLPTLQRPKIEPVVRSAKNIRDRLLRAAGVEPAPPPEAILEEEEKTPNFRERAPAALAMASAAYLLITYGGENGLIGLVLVIQMAIYAETCSVVEDYHYKLRKDDSPSLGSSFEKWWWFLTVATGTSLREIVSRTAHWSGEQMDLISYGMGVVGLLGAVVEMAGHAGHGPDEAFRAYLGKITGCFFALFFVVGQSSYWIKTMHDYGLTWVLYPALLVITNDVFAHVFDTLVGKHKLLPRLSSKKTWEGFVGAALSTLAVSVPLLTHMLGQGGETTVQHALVLATFVSFVSPFGGYLASAVKRAHGAKDFDALIPGHGGVADRFDCQVVTAPFVYFYLRVFLWLGKKGRAQ